MRALIATAAFVTLVLPTALADHTAGTLDAGLATCTLDPALHDDERYLGADCDLNTRHGCAQVQWGVFGNWLTVGGYSGCDLRLFASFGPYPRG